MAIATPISLGLSFRPCQIATELGSGELAIDPFTSTVAPWSKLEMKREALVGNVSTNSSFRWMQ